MSKGKGRKKEKGKNPPSLIERARSDFEGKLALVIEDSISRNDGQLVWDNKTIAALNAIEFIPELESKPLACSLILDSIKYVFKVPEEGVRKKPSRSKTDEVNALGTKSEREEKISSVVLGSFMFPTDLNSRHMTFNGIINREKGTGETDIQRVEVAIGDTQRALAELPDGEYWHQYILDTHPFLMIGDTDAIADITSALQSESPKLALAELEASDQYYGIYAQYITSGLADGSVARDPGRVEGFSGKTKYTLSNDEISAEDRAKGRDLTLDEFKARVQEKYEESMAKAKKLVMENAKAKYDALEGPLKERLAEQGIDEKAVVAMAPGLSKMIEDLKSKELSLAKEAYVADEFSSKDAGEKAEIDIQKARLSVVKAIVEGNDTAVGNKLENLQRESTRLGIITEFNKAFGAEARINFPGDKNINPIPNASITEFVTMVIVPKLNEKGIPVEKHLEVAKNIAGRFRFDDKGQQEGKKKVKGGLLKRTASAAMRRVSIGSSSEKSPSRQRAKSATHATADPIEVPTEFLDVLIGNFHSKEKSDDPPGIPNVDVAGVGGSSNTARAAGRGSSPSPSPGARQRLAEKLAPRTGRPSYTRSGERVPAGGSSASSAASDTSKKKSGFKGAKTPKAERRRGGVSLSPQRREAGQQQEQQQPPGGGGRGGPGSG